MVARAPREFFGAYHLLETIGRGGAAALYRARHIHPAYEDQSFCIKLLHAHNLDDATALARFRREAYVLSLLRHPNIVRTFEAGIDDDELFIAMEYVEGCDLAGLLDRLEDRLGAAAVPDFVALHIVREVLEGLHHGHTLVDDVGQPLHVIHRDIKPSNVLISYSGEVKIADFGIATLAGSVAHATPEEIVGTKGYVAPEVLRGVDADHRADIYAVGVLLYELLCGDGPFVAERTSKLLRDVDRGKVRSPRKMNPSIPRALEALMLRALSPKPAKRFASAAEMLRALAPFVAGSDRASVALLSLVRGAYVGELHRRWQDSGTSTGGEHGPTPHVLVYGRPELQKRVISALAAGEIDAEGYGSVVALERALRERRRDLVVVDAAASGVRSGALHHCISEIASGVAVIAVGELDPQLLAGVMSLNPEDVLDPALDPQRIVTAVRTVGVQRQRPLTGEPPRTATGAGDASGKTPVAVRLVTQDHAWAERLREAFTGEGLKLDVSRTGADAVVDAQHSSHRALLYDLGGGADPGAAGDVVRRFRKSPGMGPVPAIMLGDGGIPNGALPEGCAIRPRAEDPADLARALAAMLPADAAGRAFKRLTVTVAVQLRYGGRSFPATSIDISRGGMQILCPQMPPVGAKVRLLIPISGDELEIGAAVVRVDLPDASDELATVSLVFEPGSTRTQTRLIRFIGAVEKGRLRT